MKCVGIKKHFLSHVRNQKYTYISIYLQTYHLQNSADKQLHYLFIGAALQSVSIQHP